MFVVKRFTRDHDDVWTDEVARFATEAEADAFAAAEEQSRPFGWHANEWHTVEPECPFG